MLQGHALIRQVEPYLRQTGRDDDQLDLLARIAALNGLYDSDLTQMAAHLGRAEHQITGWLQRSTTNGIVEFRDSCWRVRPERLRQALVAQWFFSEPARATYTGLLDQWPEHHLVLLESASLAALLGAEAAGQFVDQHAPRQSFMSPQTLSRESGVDSSVHTRSQASTRRAWSLL
ncbi:MAG: hypothetical protein ACRDYA_07730 [Egibacteraceae bacterium]